MPVYTGRHENPDANSNQPNNRYRELDASVTIGPFFSPDPLLCSSDSGLKSADCLLCSPVDEDPIFWKSFAKPDSCMLVASWLTSIGMTRSIAPQTPSKAFLLGVFDCHRPAEDRLRS